jgi:putative flippase GtrA
MQSRPLRYLIAGGCAFVIELGSLYLLKHGFHLSDVYAVALSFWIGFLVAFGLQKWFAFENHEKQPHLLVRQLIGYSGLVAWNFGFTLLMVKLLQGTLSVFVSRTIAIVIITSWNYTVYKVLFKERQTKV